MKKLAVASEKIMNRLYQEFKGNDRTNQRKAYELKKGYRRKNSEEEIVMRYFKNSPTASTASFNS